MAVLAAIWVSVAVIMLATIDIGHFFAERRHMQAAADAAALSAAQVVSLDSACTAATSTATGIANPSSNSLPAGSNVSVTCGVWTAPTASGGSALFTPVAGTAITGQCAGLSSAGSANGQSANAVCVTVSEPVTGFFRSGITVSGSAIAKSSPYDTFTLTTSLAALNGGLANQLLQTLTGSPNALSLQAVDYQGLAQVNLKMAGILANLPVGSSTSVLNGNVTLGQLAKAELQAATQQGVAAANLNVLSAIVAALCSGQSCGGPQIALGNLVSTAVSNGTSAVSASVNALALLSTALQVANGSNAIAISKVTVTTPTALAPLLSASVTGSVSLASNPPATASGLPGPTGCGTTDCLTNTTTSQGQVFLSTKFSLLSTCTDQSVVYSGNTCADGSSPVPLTLIQLPVTLSVAPAQAGLASTTCTSTQKTATVNTQTGLLAATIGGSTTAPTPPNLNGAGSATTYAADGNSIPVLSVNLQSLLNLTGLTSALNTLLSPISALIGLNDITVNISLKTGQLTVPVANQSPTPLLFQYSLATNPPTLASSKYSCPSNSGNPYMLCLGTDQFLSPITQALTSGALTLSLSTSGGVTGLLASLLNPLLTALSGPLLAALEPILIPLLMQPIDSLLTSATGLLGLSLGNAYVTNTPDAIKCGDPMLVH